MELTLRSTKEGVQVSYISQRGHPHRAYRHYHKQPTSRENDPSDVYEGFFCDAENSNPGHSSAGEAIRDSADCLHTSSHVSPRTPLHPILFMRLRTVPSAPPLSRLRCEREPHSRHLACHNHVALELICAHLTTSTKTHFAVLPIQPRVCHRGHPRPAISSWPHLGAPRT